MAVQNKQTQQVRIIGGQWKRTPLSVSNIAGLRPTPSRVRETLFNWLHFLFDGHWSEIQCLDLFAGTGALGFEAASRGATSVTMVEENIHAIAELKKSKEKLNATQITIIHSNAVAITERLNKQAPTTPYHLIFLDPPYHQEWLPKILPLCHTIIDDNGFVYAESEIPFTNDQQTTWLSAWEIVRQDKAGMVFYYLLKKRA